MFAADDFRADDLVGTDSADTARQSEPVIYSRRALPEARRLQYPIIHSGRYDLGIRERGREGGVERSRSSNEYQF